jgi:hypothetical protein
MTRRDDDDDEQRAAIAHISIRTLSPDGKRNSVLRGLCDQ